MTSQMKLLIIDNYDSFTYNLVHCFESLGVNTEVLRNDRLTIKDLSPSDWQGVVLSPGPGRPENSGLLMGLIASCFTSLPILGVCLGMQALALHCGARVELASKTMHGKVSKVFHRGSGLFEGIDSPMTANRYHSLIVSRQNFPEEEFAITGWTGDEGRIDEVMAMAHRKLPVYGVQFHPESILTPEGEKLLENFVNLAAPQTRQKG